MKILFLAPKFFPSLGGVEKHIDELTKNLSSNYEITILVPSSTEIAKVDFYGKTRVIRYNHLKLYNKSVWRNLLFMKDYLKLFLTADIVHIHDYEILFNSALLTRLCLFWKKFYITFHGWEGIYPPSTRSIILRRVADFLTNGNICIGAYIPKLFGVNATTVSYGAIYPKDINIISDAQINSSLDIDFLYVGRFEDDTGVESYFSFVEYMSTQTKNLNIVFCGDGSLKNKLVARAAKIDATVSFPGWVSNVDDYYAKSKYIMTSGYLAILEAWSNNKLVIATYDNPIKESYLKEIPSFQEKLLLLNNNFSEIAAALCDYETVNSMKVNSFSWVKEQSWTKMVKTYERLWFGS
ncbi:glycosyltransferase family 4 protein [Catenovulum sp. 2E275]|uniref:glycosyltransferase family 4 protein n=1 Tax=Catenovulum sp. 2E275 TaxID=2980497 RepID=UPI0021D08104|nr:glycosyltransferase family 4 protein [Catenovulum sp. 2E275]MCU4677333.1 glycosyltransferase family 4 protein [Catenovulum sp. 2E275]